MRQTLVLAIAVAAVAAGFLPAGADAQACKGLIPDLEAVAGKNGITQFVNLLKNVGLSGTGPYTMFAPSDAALSTAIQSLGVGGDPSAWTAQQKYIVTQVALYHVAPGNLPSSGISKFGASVSSLANNARLCSSDTTIAGDKNTTDNFSSLNLKVDGKTVTVIAGANKATVTKADIKVACLPNIVIHQISGVLLPCDFTKYLKAPLPSPVLAPSPKAKAKPPTTKKCTPGSTIFKALSGDLTDASFLPLQIKSVLQPEFVGTVFVPTDASLTTLAASLGVSGTSPASLAALQKSAIFSELLSYHVVPTTVYNPTAPGTTPLPTLLASNTKQAFCKPASTGRLTATSTGASVTIKGAAPSTAKVVHSYSTCTGTIHVIDGVLLPCKPPANVQALLMGATTNTTTNATDPTTTGTTGTTTTGTTTTDPLTGSTTGGSRGVTLVGGSSSTNSTPAAATTTTKKSAAAAATPSALLALVAAALLAAPLLL